MNAKPRDLFARACLMMSVALLVYAAAQFAATVFVTAALVLLWRARQRRPPQSGAYGRAHWCSAREAAAAGAFNRSGLFLGRFFDGTDPGLPRATLDLFTLPPHRSALAVRQFLTALTRR